MILATPKHKGLTSHSLYPLQEALVCPIYFGIMWRQGCLDRMERECTAILSRVAPSSISHNLHQIWRGPSALPFRLDMSTPCARSSPLQGLVCYTLTPRPEPCPDQTLLFWAASGNLLYLSGFVPTVYLNFPKSYRGNLTRVLKTELSAAPNCFFPRCLKSSRWDPEVGEDRMPDGNGSKRRPNAILHVWPPRLRTSKRASPPQQTRHILPHPLPTNK